MNIHIKYLTRKIVYRCDLQDRLLLNLFTDKIKNNHETGDFFIKKEINKNEFYLKKRNMKPYANTITHLIYNKEKKELTLTIKIVQEAYSFYVFIGVCLAIVLYADTEKKDLTPYLILLVFSVFFQIILFSTVINSFRLLINIIEQIFVKEGVNYEKIKC